MKIRVIENSSAACFVINDNDTAGRYNHPSFNKFIDAVEYAAKRASQGGGYTYVVKKQYDSKELFSARARGNTLVTSCGEFGKNDIDSVLSSVSAIKTEAQSSNVVDSITDGIISSFKCDIDDVQWDESSYPKKAKLSFVVYNVSAKTAEDIRDKVEQFLSDSGYDIWPGHSVDFEKDSSYVGGSIKSAYRIYFSVKKEEAANESRSKAVKENFYSTH